MSTERSKDKNYFLYQDGATQKEWRRVEIYGTVEEVIYNIVLDYNEKMARVVDALTGGLPITPIDHHETYLYTLLVDYYRAGYPRNISLTPGEMFESVSREDTASFEDGVVMSIFVNINRLRYNVHRYVRSSGPDPISPTAYMQLHRNENIPDDEECYIRYGQIPIKISMLAPNLNSSAKCTRFLDVFYKDYLHRCLMKHYENNYSHLVRHDSLPQPFSDNALLGNGQYVVGRIYFTPITELIIFKSVGKIADIVIGGTHATVPGPKYPLPSIHMTAPRKEEE